MRRREGEEVASRREIQGRGLAGEKVGVGEERGSHEGEGEGCERPFCEWPSFFLSHVLNEC